MMDDFISHSRAACQRRGESVRDPWSSRQHSPVKLTKERQREAADMTAFQQPEQTDSNIHVFSQQTGDWQLQLSFETDARKSHLTQSPSRATNIPPAQAIFTPELTSNETKSTLKWSWQASSVPWAPNICSHWFSFLSLITQKGNLLCIQPSLRLQTSTLSSCLQHSRLNTLSNRRRVFSFGPKQACL